MELNGIVYKWTIITFEEILEENGYEVKKKDRS